MTDLKIAGGLWLPYTLSTYLSTNPPANYVPTDPQVDAWADPDGGWTNTGTVNHTNALAALWNTPAANQCFAAVVQNNGRPAAYSSRDGSETVSTTCSTALPAGAKGVRIRYDHATAKMRYYYTLDAHTVASPTWTELGTAGGSSVAGYTAGDLLHAVPRRTMLQVGTRGNSSSLMFGGVLYRVIWTDGAATIADCDLRTVWDSTRRTDPGGNLWHLGGASVARWQLTTAAVVGLETRLAAVESAGPKQVLPLGSLTDQTNSSAKLQIGTFGTVAASSLAVGSQFKVEVAGTFDAKATSGTVTGYLTANGTDVHNGTIASSQTGAGTGLPWAMRATLSVQATGVSGSILAVVTTQSVAAGGTTTTSTTKVSTTSVDLSGGLTLVAKELMATADPANTIHPLVGSLQQIV